MASITLQGNPVTTVSSLPALSSSLPAFTLVKNDLSEVSAASFAGKKLILNIFPSIDTPTCAASTRRFNEEAAKVENAVVLCISADLPFAHGRFCAAEGIEGVETLSSFRSSFGKDLGVEIADSVLAGLLSRAVIVVDEAGVVVYTEQVAEIADEPDYSAALAAL